MQKLIKKIIPTNSLLRNLFPKLMLLLSSGFQMLKSQAANECHGFKCFHPLHLCNRHTCL